MTHPVAESVADLIKKRQQQVADGVRRFQALCDAGATDLTPGPTVDLALLDGLVVFEKRQTPVHSRTRLSYHLQLGDVPAIHLSQQHRVAAAGDTPEHQVECTTVGAPAAAFWRSEVFAFPEGCQPTFCVQVVAGEYTLRATLVGVEEGRVPPGTIPLGSLSTIVAALPGPLPDRMEFIVLDETSGLVLPVRFTAKRRTTAPVNFGLSQHRVPVVEYEHQIGDAPASLASYLAVGPHVCLRHVTGIILPKVSR